MRPFLLMHKNTCAVLTCLATLAGSGNVLAWSSEKSPRTPADSVQHAPAAPPSQVSGPSDTSSDDDFGFGEMSIPGLTLNELSICGYFATRFEKTFAEPGVGGGDSTCGLSGYTSGGETTSDIAVGEYTPRSGVLPWMASDKFTVLGGYFDARTGALTLRTEYWRAAHKAQRDPEAVVEMIAGSQPNAN